MSIKQTISFVGLSYKKEMTKLLIVNLVGLLCSLLLFIFFKQIILSFMCGCGFIVIDVFLITSYQDKKKTIIQKRESSLITLISYFEIYIQNNNNVYQSFYLLLPYCTNWMKEKIETLLKEIDEDKSVQPFINFASNFERLAISSLMLSIYQMIDQGESSAQLIQFHLIFDELAKNQYQQNIEQKEKSLASMSLYPLIGAGLITIALTISIISILGDLVNVI